MKEYYIIKENIPELDLRKNSIIVKEIGEDSVKYKYNHRDFDAKLFLLAKPILSDATKIANKLVRDEAKKYNVTVKNYIAIIEEHRQEQDFNKDFDIVLHHISNWARNQ